MKNSSSTSPQGSPDSAAPQGAELSPWQRLRQKRVSYLTLPLLIMATITEIVILSTGWRYQKYVCLPPGMAVTFLGIGPIGATILAVELLKLPLAIWTASRRGWQKGFMLVIGLPLICVLTFQLVKDMAVYEMGIALTPANQMLEQADKEEAKISQLNDQLAGIAAKKADHDNQLAELAAQKAKTEADIEDSLKQNNDSRQDAISLTDYQKSELTEVEAREASIIKQSDDDTKQLTQALADLRASRETEVARASKWNAEEARIDNIYKAELSDYQNRKAAYDKAEAAYVSANFLKRELMQKPVDPGVPPVRESNTILKPTQIAELDQQIKDKENELASVDTKRRERVAEVDAEAHQLREQFEGRSSTKRDEADRKRDELLAAQATLATQTAAAEKKIDQDYEATAQTADGIRAQLDDCRKQAEVCYEAREDAIKKTQVYRIATTVEIIRNWLRGQHPVSITASSKERGDLYTDQISMVRIWVYPVLAFIVAFLPTLLVEVGFSTIFQPERQRPPIRLGFFGRRLAWLCTRSNRLKVLRAERLAREATSQIAVRDQAVTAAQAAAEKAMAEKEIEVQAARDSVAAAAAEHERQLKIHEEEWVAKLAGMADSLNRTVLEKDALRDLQKSEIERQIQMRQNAWSDRVTQLRQELDDQRAASEAERTALMQTHHAKLMEVSEASKTQVIQARRQAADAQLAAVDATAKLTHDLKEAMHARDMAESQLKQQADTFSVKLSQANEDAAREVEKAVRQEKHRLDHQQLEFAKTVRQREEDFEHRLQKREQELALTFEARLAENQNRIEQDARRREAELERQLEARALEVDARWKKDAQQREEAAQIRLRQREQQLQAQADARLGEVQAQAEKETRRREAELIRQHDVQAREAETRLQQELQRKDLAFQAQLKQREQELGAQFAAQVESRQIAAQERWETEAEKKLRAAVEPFKALVARAEKERDEAKQIAAEGARHVQVLEKKLTEASSFLNGWRNGKTLVGAG